MTPGTGVGRPPKTPTPTPTWRVRINMVLGRVLFAAAYRVTVDGRERVPARGPVVFVGNHVGVLDGPLLPAVAPRPTSVLIKREMFAGPLGRFLRYIGHIPVTRGAADRAALTAAVAVLHSGGSVGIFPEGTRGRGDVAAVQQGAAWLALQGHAPVVPVAFLGTRATGASTGSLPPWRSRLVVEFGEPVDVAAADSGLSGRQRLVVATETVRHTLASHVVAAARRHAMPLPEDDGRDPVADVA